MEKNEVIRIISKLENHYNTKFEEELALEYHKVLGDYEYISVENRLNFLMSKEHYQHKAPNLYFIIDSLPKISEQEIEKHYDFICGRCKNVSSTIRDLHKHEDRCRSAEYIIKQSKKFFNKEIDKKELMEMDELEFDAKYDKLLRIIKDNLTDDEKQAVENYFKPQEN